MGVEEAGEGEGTDLGGMGGVSGTFVELLLSFLFSFSYLLLFFFVRIRRRMRLGISDTTQRYDVMLLLTVRSDDDDIELQTLAVVLLLRGTAGSSVFAFLGEFRREEERLSATACMFCSCKLKAACGGSIMDSPFDTLVDDVFRFEGDVALCDLFKRRVGLDDTSTASVVGSVRDLW